ncbi:2-oxo acid dehydrogenase subunit E2 [Pseudolabrys sp. FHR47]|uniref:2-oxo acid dehydrogenase subunit E2 n=1 Tax=Pseudolabrys sp. FHR47 TaxID=2562284 RepID=UPI0010BE7EC0|nr:2-oxo acid dehydrogenase subunit E2 [Pseudolabrys sp. FHR47]
MDVLMPQLGETVAEGKIVKWFKQAGDVVKPGENLFEIETDKTSMEVPAIAAGTLTDIRFGVGDVAKVGAVVAVIAGVGGDVRAKSVEPKRHDTPKAPQQTPFVPAKAGTQKSQTQKQLDPRFRGDDRSERRGNEPLNSSSQSQRDFAYPDMSPWREVRTPERNFGPAKLSTGRYVTPLARRLASERGIDLGRISGSGPHGRIVAADVDKAPVPSAAAQASTSQYYLVADVEIDRLQAMQTEAKSAGAEFSIGDFVVKAWAVALQRVMPEAGADIGLITTIDGRRATTIIREAATTTLTAIAREAAGQGSASPSGATSAVAMAAASGIREFTAILTSPFVSALAVGQPRRAPIENDDGSIKFIGLMTVTLSCDHRSVDEALAADLLTTFKTLVENPVAALV